MTSLLAFAILAPYQTAPIHHALIVGLSDYSHAGKSGKENFWEDLSGDVDAGHVRDALVGVGLFQQDEVHVLAGKVTKEQFITEFKSWLAPHGRAATSDDKLYLHFSGHGYLFDPNEVERMVGSVTGLPLKGARTGFVFSDSNAGDESKLLTNVEFSSLLDSIAAANLTVTIDACDSGSGGFRGHVKMRGRVEKGLDSSKVVAGQSNGPGFIPVARPDFTIISACRFDQSAIDPGDGGLFSTAYVKALRDIAKDSKATGREPRFSELYDRTYAYMLETPNCATLQNPVIEGNRGRSVFGGKAAVYPAYFPTDVAGGQLRIEAGTFAGLRTTEHLDIYEPGTGPETGGQKLATVTAEVVGYNRTVASPPAGIDVKQLAGKWAYPTHDAADPGDVKLAFDLSLATQKAAILAKIAKEGVAVTEGTPATADAVLALGPIAGEYVLENNAGEGYDHFPVAELLMKMRDLTRWRGISLLDVTGGVCPQFETQLVSVDADQDGNHVTALHDVASNFHGRQTFAVRVRSTTVSTLIPYVTILQTTPGRTVTQFWPDSAAPQTSHLIPADGKWHWLRKTDTSVDTLNPSDPVKPDEAELVGAYIGWFITDARQQRPGQGDTVDGIGGQTLKLFATREYVDFSDLLSEGELRGDEPGKDTPLGALVHRYSTGKRTPHSTIDQVYSISKVTVESKK